MKKPLSPKFQLELLPYNCHLMVLYKPTLAKIAEAHLLMEYGLPDQDYADTVDAEVLWKDSEGVLILNLDVTNIRFGSVLAHECAHIALRVFNRIGEKKQPTGTMHEPFCYLLSNVYQRVYEACLKIDVSRDGNKSI